MTKTKRRVPTGEWNEMKQLVLARMHEHGEKLELMHVEIIALKTHVAIITDREDRELAAAKSVAVKWGTTVGALISTIIGGIFAFFRSQ